MNPEDMAALLTALFCIVVGTLLLVAILRWALGTGTIINQNEKTLKAQLEDNKINEKILEQLLIQNERKG